MNSIQFVNPIFGSKSIPDKFLNLMLSTDNSRWDILINLGMIENDKLKAEYTKTDTEILKLWGKLSKYEQLKYIIKYNKDNPGKYLINIDEVFLGECFFEFIEFKISRQLFVEIFGEDLGGNHFWDGYFHNISNNLKMSMGIYSKMDINNKYRFEREIERRYQKELEKN